MTKTSTIIRWLLDSTRPVLAPLAGSVLARIVGQVAGLFIFGWIAFRVVGFAPAPSFGVYLLITLVVLAGATILKVIARYLEQFLGHYVAFRALELLRAQAFRALAPRAPGIAARSRSGDLLARLTRDIDRIEVFFAHTLAPAVSAAVLWVAMVVGSAFVNTTLAIVAAATMLLGLAPAFLPTPRGSELDARATMPQTVTDCVYGVGDIVGYGRERDQLERLHANDRAVTENARPRIRTAAIYRAIVRLSQVLALGIGVIAMISEVRGGRIQPAIAAAGVLVLLRMWEQIRAVEDFQTGLTTSFAAARRVYQLTATPPTLRDGTLTWPEAPARIVFENVSYAYPDRASGVLKNLNLTLEAGEWTTLTGPTGGGKSTIVKLLARYDDPQSGRITIGGVSVADLPQDTLRAHVHVIPQNARLMSGSVRHNLRLGAPRASDADCLAALKTVELSDWSLDLQISEDAANISGGQKQRLALARALLADADVVVLDEATSHLNPEMDQRIRLRLRDAWRDKTVLEVTHEPNPQIYDQICEIRRG